MMKIIYNIDDGYRKFIKEKLEGISYLDNQKFIDDLVKWQHEWLNMNGITDEMIVNQSQAHHKEMFERKCPQCNTNSMSDGTGMGWEVCKNCGYMA